MKKAWPFLLVAVLIIAGGIYFLTKKDSSSTDINSNSEPVSSNTAQQEPASQSLSEADSQHLAGANTGATVDTTGQSAVTVNMQDYSFDPQVLKISKGTTVTWVNKGHNGHDVAPTNNSPNKFEPSQLLDKDESYSFTFTETGKYYYICTPHASLMRAIIEVVE